MSTSSSNWSDDEINTVKALALLPANVSDKIIGLHSNQAHVMDASAAIVQLLTSNYTIFSYEGRYKRLYYAFRLLTENIYKDERLEWSRRENEYYTRVLKDPEYPEPEYPEIMPHSHELLQFVTCLLNLLYAFARERIKEPQHLEHMERRMGRIGDDLRMGRIIPLLADIAIIPDSVTFMQAALEECLQSRSKAFMAELIDRLTALTRFTDPSSPLNPIRWALPSQDPVPFRTDDNSNSTPNVSVEPYYPHRVFRSIFRPRRQ